MKEIWEEPVKIKPIGVVQSAFKDFDMRADYDAQSTIVIREDLTEGLMGIEYFSHIFVIYHQHRRDAWKEWANWGKKGSEVLKIPFLSEPTCRGVYSTRSPARPSGMGSCVVQLLKREGNKLYVKGLDAFDGTQILDIKIYIPQYDSVPDAQMPTHWCFTHPDPANASRMFHWDTINVGLTLGLKCGSKAMELLHIGRNEAKKAVVKGGYFFAQGVEGATGCSPLNGNMEFAEQDSTTGEWSVKLYFEDKTVELRLKDKLYSGAAEVLETADEGVFQAIEVK